MSTADEAGQMESCDEIVLLVEILQGRAEGSRDFRAGTSNEDLLYALDEAVPKLVAVQEHLSHITE